MATDRYEEDEDAGEEFDFSEDEASRKHDVDLLIYFKGRMEPVVVQACYAIPKGALEEDDDDDKVKEFMEYMQDAILEVLDTHGEHRYVFTDSRHNKRVVLVSELQMISILAPDKTTLALMAA